jgi:hypothetical protein
MESVTERRARDILDDHTDCGKGSVAVSRCGVWKICWASVEQIVSYILINHLRVVMGMGP